MTDQFDDIQRWATEGGGEGDPASSVSDIRSFYEGELGNIGTLHTSETTIPETATGRPNGIFFDIHDVIEYLDGGGLIFRDPTTEEIVPNPLIHILVQSSEFYDLEEFEVWIDEES